MNIKQLFAHKRNYQILLYKQLQLQLQQKHHVNKCCNVIFGGAPLPSSGLELLLLFILALANRK